MAHFLLIYTLSPDYLTRRGEHRNEHLGLAWKASDCGDLLLGGAVGDPPTRAMLLFTSHDAAMAFAQVDPYVTSGIVTEWRVDPWVTVAGEGAATPVRV